MYEIQLSVNLLLMHINDMHLMQTDLLGEIGEADMLHINWRRPERVDELAELLLQSGEWKKLFPAKRKQMKATNHTNYILWKM